MSDVKVVISAYTQGLKDGLAKAKGDVDKFAKETEGTFSGLGGKIAGFFTFTAALSEVQRFGTALLQMASDTQDAADNLSMSAESVQGLSDAFADAGVSREKFTAGMSKLNENVQAARDGNVNMIESLERLGVTWADIRDKSPEEILYLIAEATKNAKDPLANLAALMDVFGKSGKSMKAGLMEGGEGLKKLRDESDKISDADIKRLDSWGDALAKLGRSAMVKSGNSLLDMVDSIKAMNSGDVMSMLTGRGNGRDNVAAKVAAERAGIPSADALWHAAKNKATAEGGTGAAQAAATASSTAQDPRLLKAAEDAAKLQEKEIEGIWKQMDAEKKITEERQKQLDQDAEEYQNLVKAEQKRRDALLMEQQAVAQGDKKNVEDALADNHKQRVDDMLKTPAERRQQRRDEARRERAENRAKRLEDGKGVATDPGAKGKMDSFKELKGLQGKMEKHLDEIKEAIKKNLAAA